MPVNRMIRSVAMLAMAWPLALGSATATAAELQGAVPARFQGEWRTSLKQCGTDSDDSRLTIGADRIHFYESRGPIKAVVTEGKTDLALIAELSGEGETWLSFSHFRLSADQKTLTDVTGETDESRLVRHRCPKGGK